MKENISDIKEKYKMISVSDSEALERFSDRYDSDERAGVKLLCQRARRDIEKNRQERDRLLRMHSFEEDCRSKGYSLICGIDEAGRGPLAGPVVAGAVILPEGCEIFGLNDSKKLSPGQRDELYEEITDKAVAWGVGTVGSMRIDEINILQADYEAMCEAIGRLSVMPQILLNDAVTIPQVMLPQIPIVHGDARSVSIAAASIVAKVTRDRIMDEYDSVFPEYGFSRHKGYGTAQHYAAIKKYGPCSIHRKTFLRNLAEH